MSGEHLLTYTNLLKDMIKGTNEQPDEKMHRASPKRVPSKGASVSVEVDEPSQFRDVLTNLEAF